MANIEQVIQTSVLNAAKKVEDELDRELEKLEKLDLDDLEALREKRLQDLKKAHKMKQQWLAAGHGEYYEIREEKEFFEITKKSPNMVVHFYKQDTPRCKIVDHHLKILCAKHLETRFLCINVEKAPFLTERLRVRVIPTITLVKDSNTKDYIVGFTDLGNCDDFTTDMLEWRIAQSGAIRYDGDLTTPPDNKRGKSTRLVVESKRAIRGNEDDSSDDEFFEKD